MPWSGPRRRPRSESRGVPPTARSPGATASTTRSPRCDERSRPQGTGCVRRGAPEERRARRARGRARRRACRRGSPGSIARPQPERGRPAPPIRSNAPATNGRTDSKSIPIGASPGMVEWGVEGGSVTPCRERAGEADSLALHTSGPRKAVGADGHDPKRRRRRRVGTHLAFQSVIERRSRRRLHFTPYIASSARLSRRDGSVSGLSAKTPPTEAIAPRVRPSIR